LKILDNENFLSIFPIFALSTNRTERLYSMNSVKRQMLLMGLGPMFLF
jgi:hypothetical protein